jgi:hypothetical protein
MGGADFREELLDLRLAGEVELASLAQQQILEARGA